MKESKKLTHEGKNVLKEYHFGDCGYMPDIEDWPLVNTKEDAGNRPTLYKVGIWCGSGYILDCFRAWADSDDYEGAIEAVVVWLEENQPSLLKDKQAEDYRQELINDGKSDDEALEDVSEEFYYVDATMLGAKEPHYIYNENLTIQEFPQEYIEKGAGEPDYGQQTEGIKRVKLTRENLNKMIARSTSMAITENFDRIKDLPKEQQVAIVVKEARKHMISEGTNNFFIINSIHYNVVDTDKYTETDEVTGEKADIDWDLISDVIHSTLMSAGFEEDKEDYMLRKYGYGYETATLDAALSINLGNSWAKLVPLLCLGYYDGATLDYDIRIDENWLSEYGGLDEFVSDNMWAIDTDLDNNNDDLPEAQWRTELENKKKEVVAKLQEAIDKFNEAIKPCIVKYQKAWQGSNGEAGYSKVEESVDNDGNADGTTEALCRILSNFGWSFHDGYVADNGKIVYVLSADNGNESNFDDVKQALIQEFGKDIKFGTRTAKQAPEIKYHIIAVPA